MARLLFPNVSDALVYQTGIASGLGLLNANGTVFEVFIDSACATLANIQNADGTANLNSRVIVDTQSQIPKFLGPDNGASVLFLRVLGATGNGYAVDSRVSTDTFVVKTGGDTITASTAAVVPLTLKGLGQIRNVTNKVLTGNIATLTTSVDHGFIADRKVVVAGVDAVFNGTYVILDTPSATTFRYNRVNADVASAAATGTADSYIQTANLAEWRDHVGAILSRVAFDGAYGTSSTYIDPEFGQVVATAKAKSTRPLIVRGALDQTANLAEFRNSANAVLARIGALGDASIDTTGVGNGSTVGGPALPGVRLAVHAAVAGARPLVLKGAASQIGNLTEWQDSAGVVLSAVGPDGKGIGALAGGSVLSIYGVPLPVTNKTNIVSITADVPAALLTVYTCPANKSAYLLSVENQQNPNVAYFNTTGGALSVDFFIVKSGGAAGPTNHVAKISVAAGTSGNIALGAGMMEPGDFLAVQANAAGVSVRASIIETLQADGILTRHRQVAIGTAATLVYTVPAGKRAVLPVVSTVRLKNTTGGAISVFLYYVPSGVAFSEKYRVSDISAPLDANSSLGGAQSLAAGDTIHIKGAATGVNLVGTNIWEYTP